MEGYDVLLFDAYFCDLIVTGLPEVPRLGRDIFGTDMGIHAGGTFNSVRAFHRLGVKVGWATDFGDDLFSQYVLSEIRAEGVDTSLFRMHDRPVRLFSLSFSFQDDRGFISYMDPLEPVDKLPYVLEHRPKAILLNVLDTRPEGPEFVETAHQVGARVFLDSQATQLTLDTPGVVPMLQAVDVFMPNAAEAMSITGAPNAEEAASTLAEITPLVVIKMGPEGALARTKECRIHSPGLKLSCLDTTGAGDCFNAGFISSYLRGEPLETNLRFGNICGGLSTTAHGTVAAPTLEEARKYL